MLKFAKAALAYLAALLLVIVIVFLLKLSFDRFPRPSMTVFGLVFAVNGVWMMVFPQAAMQRYTTSQLKQKRWHEKHPVFSKVFDRASRTYDGVELGEAAAPTLYQTTRRTKILGAISLLIGLLSFYGLWVSA